MKIKTLIAAAMAVAGLGATVDVAAQEKHGWRGHHRYHGHGHRHWHPHFGFYIGAPLAWGAYYWGDPWYWHGPRTVYREVIREPHVVEVEREVIRDPAAEPKGPGAPSQGPLYMNYCESAKAYFPKVQSCPEGWKFISPTQ